MTLREYRYSKGLQRQFVATKIGICGKHLNDIESGKVNLTENVKQKLSQFYHMSTKEIDQMYEEGKNDKN